MTGQHDLSGEGSLTYHPVAMTAGGSVCARIYRHHQFDAYAVPNGLKDEWHKISRNPKGTLIGSDAESLIFAQHDGGWTVIHNIAVASLKVAPLGE
jgi:hypothetical protein